MSSLSSKLKAFRSSGLGSKLIPDLYEEIEEILISEMEEELEEALYRRSIDTEALSYVSELCSDITPILSHHYDDLLETIKTPVQRLGLIKALQNVPTDNTFLYVELLKHCYDKQDTEALEILKIGPLDDLIYCIFENDTLEQVYEDEEIEEFYRIYKEVFGNKNE